LWRASGRSAAKVAAELGIRAPLLYRWVRPQTPSQRRLPATALPTSTPDWAGDVALLRHHPGGNHGSLCGRGTDRLQLGWAASLYGPGVDGFPT